MTNYDLNSGDAEKWSVALLIILVATIIFFW